MTSENYSGYKITYGRNKYTARKGRKTFSSHADINILKSCIDAWNRNIELSDRINKIPEGQSSNPNVVRTYEKDNKGGY